MVMAGVVGGIVGALVVCAVVGLLWLGAMLAGREEQDAMTVEPVEVDPVVTRDEVQAACDRRNGRTPARREGRSRRRRRR